MQLRLSTLLVTFICALLIHSNSIAQPFIPSSWDAFIVGITDAGVDWGDYDNDDDLDLIMIGNNGNTKYSRIYTNNPGTFYSNIVGAGIGLYTGADASWGDLDNDGYLDYIFTGSILSCTYSPVVMNRDACLDEFQIRNFVQPSSGLQGVQVGSTDWGDFDNDGDLDLVILGGDANAANRYTIIYENINDTMFMHTSLIGLARGTAKWADVDNDMDLDVFITGQGATENEAYLYINNNGVFTNSGNFFTGVNYSDADFGDYDNDGDLDLVLAGDTSQNEPFIQLYNNIGGVFSPVSTSFIPIRECSVRWGDMDNDGDLDLIAVGDSTHITFGMDFVTSIYQNDGGGLFTPIVHTIPGYKNAGVRWADHDQDGDLDFILTGYKYSSPNNAGDIYENQLSAANANTIPNTPTGLSSSVNDYAVDFSWSPASDNETPQNGLNYNMRVGASPMGIEVMTPTANRVSGYRRKVEIGNTESNSGWKLVNQIPGDYFWSVQSIDGAFAGSVFAPEQTYTVFDTAAPTLQYPYNQLTSVAIDTLFHWYAFPGALSYHIQIDTNKNFAAPLVDLSSVSDTFLLSSLDFNTHYYWRVRANTATGYTPWSFVKSFETISLFTEEDFGIIGSTRGQVSFGDFDNDTDMDIAVVGDGPSSTDLRKIYEYNNGTYTDYNATNLTQHNQGGASWADYDNDSDLDLLINSINSNEIRLYENDGGNFVDHTGNIQAINYNRKTAWADYDNDGDLDFAYLGVNVFKNTNGVFTSIGATFANIADGDLAWGDYDGDKDMDLIMTGALGASGFNTRLYRNDGNDVFTEVIGHGIQSQTHYARVRWGDVDADGDLDLLLSGQTSTIPYAWTVYENNGGTFTVLQTVTDGINYGDIQWGDLDNDGDLDVVVCGNDLSYIYMLEAGQYVRKIQLCGYKYASLDLADYDDDNDLDIVIAGEISGKPVTRVYTNNSVIKNTDPLPPTTLYANTNGGTVELNWNMGSDAETAASGLTYNYYFSSTPMGIDTTSPMADLATGKRRIAEIGNTNSNLGWVLDNIAPGTYYWSVQSIDNNYDGSHFAPEQTVVVTCNSSIVDVQTACDSYNWIDGNTYTANTSSPSVTLVNMYGCDSIVTLNLTMSYSSTGTDIQSACDSYTWMDGVTYTASTNSPTWILPSANGCDSVVTLNLSLTYSSTGTDVQTACDSYTWIDGITYTSSTNSPTWIVSNAAGCDSLVTLNLTITNSNSTTDTQIACDTYTWIDGITYTNSTNSPTWTLMNAEGCDSLVTLNLTITNSTSGADVQTACESYTWIDGVTYTSSTTSPTWMLTNAAGCDSLVTLNLTIGNANVGTDVQAACDSYTWIDGITYTSSTSSPTWILTNASGCDSLVTLNLTIGQSSATTDVQSACDSYTWIDGITYTASTNTPTWTLTNANGCDSIITLNLTVNTVDVTTSINTIGNQFELVSNGGPSYQWIENCGTSNDVIPGATNQTFIPSMNGIYAVIVSNGDCSDTSACIVIDKLDIGDAFIHNLVIYPNPTKGTFMVESDLEGTFVIRDVAGRLIKEGKLNEEVDLSQHPSGIYLIHMNNRVYRVQLTKF